jgi:hypothetical protein
MTLDHDSMGLQPQPQQDESGPYYEGTNGFAIASLVLGIIGLTAFPVIPSIIAIIFGYKGRREIDRSGGRQHGRGMATAGLALGWIAIVLVLVAIAVGVLLFAIPIGFATFGSAMAPLGL